MIKAGMRELGNLGILANTQNALKYNEIEFQRRATILA